MLVSKDVRAALRNVELEETPLGIVYYTDAVQSKKVKIVATFLEESHEPIVYYQAQCSDKKVAKHFYTWLQSATTEKILQAHGFQK
jgi:molybdate transport system substrate-binding protein